MSLKEKIKAGAIRFGFVDVGFTSVFPVPGLQRYKQWIEDGQHAGMDYLASHRALEARSDPRKLLPSCRTIISLLSSYPPPGDLQMERMHEIGSDGDLRSDRVLEIGSGGDLRSDCVLGEDTGTINRGDTGTINRGDTARSIEGTPARSNRKAGSLLTPRCLIIMKYSRNGLNG
jgi:hypothetical protein